MKLRKVELAIIDGRRNWRARLAFSLLLGAVFAASAWTGCATFHPQPISPAQTADNFNRRSLNDPSLRRFLSAHHIDLSSRGLDLEALVLAAFYYQPALAEARAKVSVAAAAKITAGQRPNPSLSVTPGYDAGIPGNPSPWLVTVTPEWPVETAGKRRRRIEQTAYLAEASQWNLIGAVWQVRSQVRSVLLRLYAARKLESALREQTSAQSNVVRLMQGQLAAGNVSGYDLTQARIALDTIKLQWQDAVSQNGEALAQLANALGVPAQALDGVEFSFTNLDQFPKDLTRPEVQRLALLNRSDVRQALAEYAASQSALQLQIANQYPDLHLGPGYAWNAGSAGDSEWNLGVTLTLPLLNHNQGPVAEAQARRAEAAAHFQTVQARAIGNISLSLSAYQAALRQAATAKSLWENLRLRLDSARHRERSGEIDPLTLANATVEFESGAQNQIGAMSKVQQALGQLEDAVQSPLTLSPAIIQTAEQEASRSK